MASYTPEQREAILAEAREHLESAKDFTPREADVLADMAEALERRFAADELKATCQIDQSDRMVTRSLANADNSELVAALVAEVTEQLDSHRGFIADQLAEVVAALVDGSVEHVNKQTDALRTELLTQIETLRAETAQLRAEVARLSADGLANGRGGGFAAAVLKH